MTQRGDVPEVAEESGDVSLPEVGGTSDLSVLDGPSMFEPQGDPSGLDMTAKSVFEPGGGPDHLDRRQ
jgi:hypothetical protein